MTAEKIEPQPYRLEIVLPGLPLLPNRRRVHWGKLAREARMWKSQVLAYVKFNRLAPPSPLKSARLTLTRYSSSQPDEDGLEGSFKNVIDGLKEAQVIFDDAPKYIGKANCRWEKASPGKGKIRIQVEEVA